MGRKQGTSDPLPYVQIDRAIEPTAALLAAHMRVTHQHAIGSLYAFWKLCSDPRELESILEKTPLGHEPSLVLTADDVGLRWQLASDQRVEPVVLARLGVLEERDPGYRVRGMSRAFDPIARRVLNRRIASKGGVRSAEARKASGGMPQPGTSGRFGGGSGDASVVASATLKRNRTQHRSETEPNTEAKPNPAPNTEIRDQRSEISMNDLAAGAAQQADLLPPAQKAKKAAKARKPSAWEEIWAQLQGARRARLSELGLPDDDEIIPPGLVNKKLSEMAARMKALPAQNGVEWNLDARDIPLMWDRYLWNHWAKTREPPFPFLAFASEKVWFRALQAVGSPRDPVTTLEWM